MLNRLIARLLVLFLLSTALACTKPPATPLITILADQTLVVPVGVEDAPEMSFNVTGPGTLKGFIDVISGERISYRLYSDASGPGWAVAKGDSVSRSLFEVPLDTGMYKLTVVADGSSQDGTGEGSAVSVYLEFWS